MARRPISDEEASAASDVLQRKYQQWVDATARDLAEEVMRGEIEDSGGLHDRLHETVDDSMTYTYDQHLVLFASESISEGADEMRDMGGGGNNPVASLAFCTFRVDVQDALSHLGLGGDFDQGEWVREVSQGEHGAELAVLWDKLAESGLELPEE